MANITNGTNCFIGFGCYNINYFNCNNCVFEPLTHDITAIECEDMVFDATYNNQVVVKGTIVGSKKSTTGTGSAPTTVNNTYGLYYADDTLADVYFQFDNPAYYIDVPFTFVRTTAGGNNIIFTDFGGELLNGAALPQTLLATQWDKLTLTSNGTDWIIIM